MTQAVAAKAETKVTRPLKELVVLIHADLADMSEAREKSSIPYYIAIGEKLLEAKGQLKHGEFTPWYKSKFGFSQQTASTYMRLASEQTTSADVVSSLREFRAQTSPAVGRTPGWQASVGAEIKKVDAQSLSIKQAEDEKKLRSELALQLIQIGFKALADKLHPDKGGSNAGMSRLNGVRNRLREFASNSNAFK